MQGYNNSDAHTVTDTQLGSAHTYITWVSAFICEPTDIIYPDKQAGKACRPGHMPKFHEPEFRKNASTYDHRVKISYFCWEVNRTSYSTNIDYPPTFK